MFRPEYNYRLADQPADRLADSNLKLISIALILVSGAVAVFSIPYAVKSFHTTAEVVVAAGGLPAIPLVLALGFNSLRGLIS